MLKAIGVVGSPRRGGNTEMLTAHCLKAMAEEGLETELVRLAGRNIAGCNACGYCFKNEGCSIKDDFQPVYEKLVAADAIIIGAPVYYSAAPAFMKGLLERTGFCSRRRRIFAGKVGGPLVVGRRAGHNFTFVELLLWFHIMEIVNPGSIYWNVAFGRETGEVQNDKEGMDIAWHFGKNVARVVKALRGNSI